MEHFSGELKAYVQKSTRKLRRVGVGEPVQDARTLITSR